MSNIPEQYERELYVDDEQNTPMLGESVEEEDSRVDERE